MGVVFLVNTILDLKEMGGCSSKKAGNLFSGDYLPPGEMKCICLDILLICISFESVFDADQQSYNNHTLKINIFPDISFRSKTNDVIEYVMTRVKLSKYVFHAYHSKGNVTLINNHMSIIHSTSIFVRIIRFEVDEIADSFMKPFLTPFPH